MPQMPDEMYEIHAILKRYIAIHENVFNFSWRKVIPIPGLFRPINYGQHFKDLSSLVSSLDQLGISLSKRTEIPNVFYQYIISLFETIEFLRDICKRLYEKSEGDFQSYTKDEYELDVVKYNNLINKYRSLGAELNQWINR